MPHFIYRTLFYCFSRPCYNDDAGLSLAGEGPDSKVPEKSGSVGSGKIAGWQGTGPQAGSRPVKAGLRLPRGGDAASVDFYLPQTFFPFGQ